MTALLALLLAVAFAFSANAAELSGVVRNFADGRAISGAGIQMTPLNRSVITDQEGRYLISDLPTGRQVVTVSKDGFHPYIFEHDVTDAAAHYAVNVELKPSESGETTPEYLEQQPKYKLPEVTVLTTRASAGHPVTYTNLKRDEIADRNYGQDLPLLLTELPNVIAYSDGGSGMGYSYLRMRGFGQNRIAVQLNGVPLNDAGTGEVFWIDLPDFASDLEDVQVQRGVGSSLYGPAAFGGTINMVTRTPGLRGQPSLRVEGTLGAWNTRRAMIAFESGRLKGGYGFAGRLTRMKTDGYRDGSWADLWSYYFSAARFTRKHTTRAVFYGGPEQTHLAYEGISKEQLKTDRRANPLDFPGEIDNFFQPHYELHDEFRITSKLTLNNSLYLFRGDGYYDQWRTGQEPARYYYNDGWGTFDYVNVLRRRNVGETDWGWVPRLSIEHKLGTTDIGGELRIHRAQHWGEIRFAEFISGIEGLDDAPVGIGDPQYHYYDYRIRKESGAFYVHNLIPLNKRLRAMADVQLRYAAYRMDRDQLWNVTWEKAWAFFSPRLGLNYDLLTPEKNSNLPSAVIYVNFSESDREPTYKDSYDPQDFWSLPMNAPSHFANGVHGGKYIGPGLVPETMDNLELGTLWQYRGARLGLNYYWMNVKDEIVPYGTLDDMGVPVTGNASRTRHSGVEFVAACSPWRYLSLSGNLALTDHTFKDYREYDWNSGELVKRDGKRLAMDPSYVGNLRTEFTYSGAFAALTMQTVGKQYIDNANTEDDAISAFMLLNLDLGYKFRDPSRIARIVELRLRVNNLLGKEYETYGYQDGGPRYIVGAPRAVYTTLGVEL